LFFLPTRGENFGHVISESLQAGCPVLISDQTPWQGLEEKKAGWVNSLLQPERFQAVLQEVLEMDDRLFREWSRGARAYGKQTATDATNFEANRKLFLTVCGQN
jgi:glycosyltransferase involved in cell wall biosynthesis